MNTESLQRPTITLEIPAPAPRVLIADDNPDDVTTTALLLHLEGFSVRGFASAKALLEQFGEFRPDVVILDLGMPGVSGYDAARELRDARRWKDFLVIAVTGHATMTDHFLSRMAGFDHHVAKPADPNALLALIREYLARRPTASD